MEKLLKNYDTSEDEKKIAATVYDYFNGYVKADFAQLDGAFSDKAAMFGVIKDKGGEEEIGVWPNMNETIERWSANKIDPNNFDCEILHMNVVDDRIATVHLRFADQYYDALTLAKVNGVWEVVAKVFIHQ